MVVVTILPLLRSSNLEEAVRRQTDQRKSSEMAGQFVHRPKWFCESISCAISV